MNGYLARLMRQSAVRIGPNEASPKFQLSVLASGPVTAVSDVIEQETLREAPLQQEPPRPAIRVSDAQSATTRADKRPAKSESCTEATPEREPLRPAESIEPRQSAAGAIPFVSIGQARPSPTPDDRISAIRANPFPEELRDEEEVSSSAPTPREIVEEVVAWMADTQSPAAREKSTTRAARSVPVADSTPADSKE